MMGGIHFLNTMSIRLGKNELAMLRFFQRLGKGRLHSLVNNRATRTAANGLERKGFLIQNEYGQAEYTGKEYV
jgi:hypothetical protein